MTSTPQQAKPLPVINGWRPLAADDQAAAARAEAEQVLADARRQADATIQRAQQEADHHLETAKGLRARTLASADTEADRIREKARQETETKRARGKAIDVWSLRGALAATIGLTASGEFALAQLAGWGAGLAWLLPVAIDVYVVQAFRRHRDVPAALALMVLANAIFHLADRGLFGVVREHGQVALSASGEPRPEWWLIVAVAAIAPVVMWRIHRLSAPARKRESKTPSESPARPAKTRTPAARESAPAGPRESCTRNNTTRTHAARESKPKAPASKRESSPKPAATGGIADEIDRLVALMRERGGADAVGLSDAERIVASTSQATAARRLKTARETYRNNA